MRAFNVVLALGLLLGIAHATEKTPDQLKADAAATFTANGAGQITGPNVRDALTNIDDSFIPKLYSSSGCYWKSNGLAVSASCEAIPAPPVPPATSILYTAPSGNAIGIDIPITLNARFPESYGAAGSTQSTTCITVAGTPTATCASAIDFAANQYVRINGAGAAYAGTAPSAIVIGQVGAAGATTYGYTIRPIGANGSFGPALTIVTTATGNATLSFTNYNTISWTPSASGVVGYAVYKGTASPASLIGVTTLTTFHDYGVVQVNTSDWIPATNNAAPSTGNQWLIAKITNVSGTTLTLDTNAGQSVTNGFAGHDDTTPISNMIAACTTQCEFKLMSTYPITGTVWMSKSGIMQGAGNAGDSHSTSRLIWKGGPDGTVLQLGSNTGTTIVGSGTLQDIEIDGQGVAAYALVVKDANYCVVRKVVVEGATVAGLFRTNSLTAPLNINCTYYDVLSAGLLYSMTEADGLRVDGLNNGITMDKFFNFRASHIAGHGIHWVSGTGHGAGDAFAFYEPFIFRTASQTGYGLFMETNDPNMVTGDMFVTYPLMNGGIYFSTPGRVELSKFIGFDTRNVATVAYASMPFLGPGKGDLGGSSMNGTNYGIDRYPCGLSSACRDDSMTYIAAFAGGFATANGNWAFATNGTGTATGLVAGVQGVGITTDAAAPGDYSAILYPSLAVSGLTQALYFPALEVSLQTAETANFTARVGYADSLNNPPNNSVTVEFDPAVSASWRCVTRSGGVATSANPTTAIPNSNGILRWRIEFETNQAVFYFALGNAGALATSTADIWYPACVITTNVPTVNLRAVATMITNAAAAKSLSIYHWKESHYLTGW